MSSASGSPDENKPLPGLGFLTRRGWRTTGIVSVVVSAVMAWNGVAFIGAGWHWLALIAYWGTVIALVVVAVYTVLLDLRFTQLHYVLCGARDFSGDVGQRGVPPRNPALGGKGAFRRAGAGPVPGGGQRKCRKRQRPAGRKPILMLSRIG